MSPCPAHPVRALFALTEGGVFAIFSGISPRSPRWPGAKPPSGRLLHFWGDGIRTNVYIDGFNFYYGALRKTPYRWVNIRRLCELLLPKNTVADG